MATPIKMRNPKTGVTKNGFIGFSWTTFFWGGFPAMFRGDFVLGLVLIILNFILFWIPGIIAAFIYNKHYTTKLLDAGYEFDDTIAKKQLARSVLGISANQSSNSVNILQMQMQAQQQQLDELRKMQMPSSGARPLPPIGARDMIKISKGGEDWGQHSVADVKRMLDNGKLTLEDYYFDTACNEWLELAGHPTLNTI